MKMVNTLKQNKVFFAVIIVLLSASVSFGAKQNTYPTKATPVGADKALIVDSVDNSTKQANLNAMRAALGLGTTADAVFGTVNAAGGTLSSGVANTTQGALILYTNTDPLYYFGITPAASPTAMVSLKAPPAMPTADNSLWNCDINGTCGWTDPATFATPTGSAASMTIDASGFNGNLATTVNTLQKLGDAVDDLVLGSGGGYTNLTEFLGQTAWRLFYSDGSGDVKELALGSDGEYLKSNGAALAPSWATPSGAAHDAVTLDANLGNNLLGLSTQQLTLDSQTANYVFAAPNGSAGVPSFRALVAADVPTLNQNTTGTAAGLTTQYIDWNAVSGGSSIANKPAIVTTIGATGADTNIPTEQAVREALDLKANSSGISFVVATLSDLKYDPDIGTADDEYALITNTGSVGDANDATVVPTLERAGTLFSAAAHSHTGTYQPADAQLDTWAGVTPSSNGQSLVSAANYAAMLALLDLEPGVDFDTATPATLTYTTDTSITTANLLASKYISNYGASGEVDLILPAPAYNLTRTVVVEAAQIVEVCPPSGELFDLAGTLLDVDDCIDSPAVAGAKAVFTRSRTGASTWRWSVDMVRGTWTDTGASD